MASFTFWASCLAFRDVVRTHWGMAVRTHCTICGVFLTSALLAARMARRVRVVGRDVCQQQRPRGRHICRAIASGCFLKFAAIMVSCLSSLYRVPRFRAGASSVSCPYGSPSFCTVSLSSSPCHKQPRGDWTEGGRFVKRQLYENPPQSWRAGVALAEEAVNQGLGAACASPHGQETPERRAVKSCVAALAMAVRDRDRYPNGPKPFRGSGPQD